MATKETKHLEQMDKHFEQVDKLREKLMDSFVDYWQHYSSWGSWQFWFLLVMGVLPLIILYFFIDRKKAMHIGFFGFNIHVWSTKLDEIALATDLWDYKYKLIPYLQSMAVLDASFLPVSFMLLYQWTLNYKKNYYIYATGLCVFFAFLFKPALVAFGIFHIKGVHYWYLFVAYMIVMVVSKLITNIFIHFQEEPENPLANVIQQGEAKTSTMNETEQDE